MDKHTNDTEAPFGTYAPGLLLAAILKHSGQASAGWLSRRFIFALRRLGLLLLNGQPADVERLGCHMRLYPYKNTAEKRLLFTPQLFDPDERAYLAPLITPGFTFADIGANVGGYALFVAALAGHSGRVLAVEPQPDIFDRLRSNVQQSGLTQVMVRRCAVSDQEGEVVLHIHADNQGESTLLDNGEARHRQVRVEAFRLERLIRDAGFDRLDALKIDVEGLEDRILTEFFGSAAPALWPDILIVEDGTLRWQLDVHALLTQSGYRQVLTTPTNSIYRLARPASARSD